MRFNRLLARRALLTASIVVGGAWIAPTGGRSELPPGQRVNQLQVCQDCHDLRDELQAPVSHSPVTRGECSACHNPHASRFEKLLLTQPGPLCESCHPSVARQQTASRVHRPVAEGRCSECHNSHGSAHPGLLVESGTELCISCHGAIEGWQGKSVQHRPFEQGRCDTCHVAHASENEGLLKTAGARICQSCHAFNPAFKAAHAGYPVEQANCQTCHDPHASSRKGLFRERVHESFAAGRCEDCHVQGGSNDPFATIKPGDALCADCHRDAVVETATASFAHVAGGTGTCTSCHNPHAGEGRGMLRRDLNTTCLRCHDPGGSSSGQKGRFVTHADADCTTCHSPHGGEWPLLSPKNPIEVCGDCHTHEHGVRHPLGEETIDPRNGMPMDCSSCHGIHDAPFEDYLYSSDEGDLCLDCHRNLGGGRS